MAGPRSAPRWFTASFPHPPEASGPALSSVPRAATHPGAWRRLPWVCPGPGVRHREGWQAPAAANAAPYAAGCVSQQEACPGHEWAGQLLGDTDTARWSVCFTTCHVEGTGSPGSFALGVAAATAPSTTETLRFGEQSAPPPPAPSTHRPCSPSLSRRHPEERTTVLPRPTLSIPHTRAHGRLQKRDGVSVLLSEDSEGSHPWEGGPERDTVPAASCTHSNRGRSRYPYVR